MRWRLSVFSPLLALVLVTRNIEALQPKIPSQKKGFTWDDNTTPKQYSDLIRSEKANENDECTPLNAAQMSSAPLEWRDGIQSADILYTNNVTGHPLPPIANGYVGTFVGSDGVFLAGVFNGYLNLTSNPMHASSRARIPSPSNFNFQFNTAKREHWALDLRRSVFMTKGNCYPNGEMHKNADYQRVKSSPHTRRFASRASDCVFSERWYAHRARRGVFVYQLEVSGGATGVNISLTNTPGPPSTDIKFISNTTDPVYTVMVGKTLQTEAPDIPPVEVAVVFDRPPQVWSVYPGTQRTLTLLASFRSTLDSSSPASDAVADYHAAAQLSYSSLFDEHTAEVAKLHTSGIDVDCLALAQNVNASFFYIQSSIRADFPYSLSPGGMASNGYNGHTFWDCETWMAPNLLLFNPEIGRSIFSYRLNRLPGAEEKARSYNKGYKGAMFPWESAFSGLEEATANTGYYEQHITGDVSYAVQQYWRLTEDSEFATWIWPLVEKTAMFWASRVEPGKGKWEGHYVINGVTPPDEYEVNVNNSVYTNVVASYNLKFAVTLGEVVGASTPSEWTEIADKLAIPFDNEKQIHLEYDSYNGEQIKQADVILLGFPLDYAMGSSVRLNDLVYYSNRTTPNGPAMTWGMEAVGLLESGNTEAAIPVFKRSYANIHPPFALWLETPTGGTLNFITGAGGWLQTLWGGYGGLRIKDRSLSFQMRTPPGAKQMSLRGLTYRGNVITVSYSETSRDVTIRLDQTLAKATALAVDIGSQKIPLNYGTDVVISSQSFSITPV